MGQHLGGPLVCLPPSGTRVTGQVKVDILIPTHSTSLARRGAAVAKPSLKLPSASQAKSGYPLVLINARRHLTCAEILAANDQHGSAVAHLVLATEEAVKAVALFMVSEGLAPRQMTLRALLTQHGTRQLMGFLAGVLDFLATGWGRIATRLNEDFPDRSSEAYRDARAERVAEFVAELNRVADAPRGQTGIMMLDWWNRANALKQRGLYVDFRRGTWIGPDTVSADEYATSHEFVMEVVTTLEEAAGVISRMTDDERAEISGAARTSMDRLRKELQPRQRRSAP